MTRITAILVAASFLALLLRPDAWSMPAAASASDADPDKAPKSFRIPAEFKGIGRGPRGFGAVGISPSKTYYYATADFDTGAVVYLWKVSDGSFAHAIHGRKLVSSPLAWAPDDSYVIMTGGVNLSRPDQLVTRFERVRVVDNAQTVLASTAGPPSDRGQIARLLVTADGKQLVAYHFAMNNDPPNCNAHLDSYSLVDGKRTGTAVAYTGLTGFGNDHRTDAVLSPDGKMVATVGRDIAGNVAASVTKLWAIEGLKPIAVGRVHDCDLGRVAFRPDGKQMLTWDGSGRIRSWSVNDLTATAGWPDVRHERPTDGSVLRVAADGRVFAGSNAEFGLWASDGKELVRAREAGKRRVELLPDGSGLLTASSEGPEMAIRSLKTETAAVVAGRLVARLNDTPRGLVFTATGDKLVAWSGGPSEAVVKLIAPDDGTIRESPIGGRPGLIDAHRGVVYRLGLRGQPAQFDPARAKNLLLAVDLSTGKDEPKLTAGELLDLLGERPDIGQLAVSPAGDRVLIANSVSPWVLLDKNWREVARGSRDDDAFGDISSIFKFSPDGSRFVAVNRFTDNRQVAVVADASGKELGRVRFNRVGAVDFSADARWMYVASAARFTGDVVSRYDVKTGHIDSPFTRYVSGTEAHITAFAVSTKRPVIAVAERDHKVRLFNADTGALITTFGAEESAVALAFSPDGTKLYASVPQPMLRNGDKVPGVVVEWLLPAVDR